MKQISTTGYTGVEPSPSGVRASRHHDMPKLITPAMRPRSGMRRRRGLGDLADNSARTARSSSSPITTGTSCSAVRSGSRPTPRSCSATRPPPSKHKHVHLELPFAVSPFTGGPSTVKPKLISLAASAFGAARDDHRPAPPTSRTTGCCSSAGWTACAAFRSRTAPQAGRSRVRRVPSRGAGRVPHTGASYQMLPTNRRPPHPVKPGGGGVRRLDRVGPAPGPADSQIGRRIEIPASKIGCSTCLAAVSATRPPGAPCLSTRRPYAFS